jgi:hypothetical protein
MKRKGWLVIKCYMGIETYKKDGTTDWFFGTLTMHRKWRGAASVTNFRKNWNKFYQRMKRATNGNMYYVLLPERHKDGSLHVHIISTCGKETRWWKDNGAKCGMGFKSENKPLLSTAKAAWYVTKYVGKAVGQPDWPADLRRVRFSVRWPKPIQDQSWSWQCVPPDMAKHAVRKRLAMGYKITNAITGEIVNVKPHAIKPHTPADSFTRRLSNSDLSAADQQLLESFGVPAPRVGTPKDQEPVQFQARQLPLTSDKHWD